MPGSIQIVATLNSGNTVTVQWTAATNQQFTRITEALQAQFPTDAAGAPLTLGQSVRAGLREALANIRGKARAREITAAIAAVSDPGGTDTDSIQ